MKAYLDANIYVCYLLGEEGEEEIDRMLETAAKCRFSIVASNTVFAEVQRRCQNAAVPLLQVQIDKLNKAGKLAIEIADEKVYSEANLLNMETGGRYGQSDFIHALLAAKYADCLVTNDLKFCQAASRLVRTQPSWEFMKSLEF